MKTKLASIYLTLSLVIFASGSEKETVFRDSSGIIDVHGKTVFADVLKYSRGKNNRNAFLDHYLLEKKIELPQNDFILVAYQPVGVVSSCIIIDLKTQSVRILPGTHEKKNEKIVKLSESEFDYLTELNSSDLMKNFPSQSGNIGRDGHSLVIYAKFKKAERYISHWKPVYMGLHIFTSIHDHFKIKSNKIGR